MQISNYCRVRKGFQSRTLSHGVVTNRGPQKDRKLWLRVITHKGIVYDLEELAEVTHGQVTFKPIHQQQRINAKLVNIYEGVRKIGIYTYKGAAAYISTRTGFNVLPGNVYSAARRNSKVRGYTVKYAFPSPQENPQLYTQEDDEVWAYPKFGLVKMKCKRDQI